MHKSWANERWRELSFLADVLAIGVAQLALSLRAEGYHVAVDLEASGTFNQRVAEAALSRMQASGVQIMNLFSINAELFRDWQLNHPSPKKTVPYLDQYVSLSLSSVAMKFGKLIFCLQLPRRRKLGRSRPCWCCEWWGACSWRKPDCNREGE